MINVKKIKFPRSRVAFHADHIDIEFYGFIQVSGAFVQIGDIVSIDAGSLKVNLL
jgi:hypothetical protein